MKFLGFPDSIPDSRTIWLFRERMSQARKDELVWEEFQRQLDSKGLQVKKRNHSGCDVYRGRARKFKETSRRECQNSSEQGWYLG